MYGTDLRLALLSIGFYPQKRSLSLPLENQDSSVIFAVVERDQIIVAYGESEDLSDFIGSPLSTLKESHPHREIVALEREMVDQWVQTAVSNRTGTSRSIFSEKSASPQLESKVRNSLKRKTCLAEKHFFLDSLLGGWGRTLPRAYGVFIRLEKSSPTQELSQELIEKFGPRCKEYLEQEQDILILFRGGKVERFYEPDLSSMGSDRRNMPQEVVRYLSEKHSVKVQGIVTPYVEWMSWGQAKRPWRLLAKSLREKNTRLTPFNWKIASLLTLRAVSEI